MKTTGIHLVSFDIPFPPVYGGVMDVFYKLKALHQLGIPVYLHCFQYHSPQAPELEQWAQKVYYYPRQPLWKSIWRSKPYIVHSRQNPDLLQNLLANDWPILFEGEHCCAFLGHRQLQGRIQWVRIHNIESHYYHHLASQSNSQWKRIYYRWESKKLAVFEPELSQATGLFSISDSEIQELKKWNSNVVHLGPFHGNAISELPQETGQYSLYHGNLAVEENENAALWILDHATTIFPLVVAGANPGKRIIQAVANRKNTSIIANPTDMEMRNLITNAQIIVLPTFQSTGVKLKLVNSLFSGRHILANAAMVKGSGLENLCIIFEDGEDLNHKIIHWMEQPIDPDQWQKRITGLKAWSDLENGKILIEKLLEIKG